MTESEAVEKLKNMRLFMQIEDENNDCKFTEDDYKALVADMVAGKVTVDNSIDAMPETAITVNDLGNIK